MAKMTRSGFLKSITACMVASAISVGFVARRKWRFATKILNPAKVFSITHPVENKYWACAIMQMPENWRDGMGYEGCYQFIARGDNEADVRSSAAQVILERKYELGVL